MGGDCKVFVELENGPVVATPAEVTVVRNTSYRWRTTGALLAMALCVSAALFFTWHAKSEDPSDKTDDVHLTLRQLSGKQKDAIHLEGEYDSDFYEQQVHWKDNVGQGFAQGHLQLENNEIVIPRDGLYFVYTQASFKVNCQASSDQQMVDLSHMVKIWSGSFGGEDTYRPLLYSVRTACERMESSGLPSGYWYNAVYMGAVFKLKRGDKLKTEIPVKLLPDLEGDEGRTFFGAFAL